MWAWDGERRQNVELYEVKMSRKSRQEEDVGRDIWICRRGGVGHRVDTQSLRCGGIEMAYS